MAFAAPQQNGGGVGGSCFSQHTYTANKLRVIWAEVPTSRDRSEDIVGGVVTRNAEQTWTAFDSHSHTQQHIAGHLTHTHIHTGILWRCSAKFMATFMCRVACAVNTGNAGKKCIINDVINPHAHSHMHIHQGLEQDMSGHKDARPGQAFGLDIKEATP